MYTDTAGQTTRQDAVARHGVTPVGRSSNGVIEYILDGIKADKDAKKERKISQHGVKDIPFNVDCQPKNDRKEYANVNDSLVGIETVMFVMRQRDAWSEKPSPKTSFPW